MRSWLWGVRFGWEREETGREPLSAEFMVKGTSRAQSVQWWEQGGAHLLLLKFTCQQLHAEWVWGPGRQCRGCFTSRERRSLTSARGASVH